MVRDPDWEMVTMRTTAQAKGLPLTSNQLMIGISNALEARDMGAVAALLRQLAVVDPRSAQAVIDVIDLGLGF